MQSRADALRRTLSQSRFVPPSGSRWLVIGDELSLPFRSHRVLNVRVLVSLSPGKSDFGRWAVSSPHQAIQVAASQGVYLDIGLLAVPCPRILTVELANNGQQSTGTRCCHRTHSLRYPRSLTAIIITNADLDYTSPDSCFPAS
jgi:hypothetical protein